MFSNHRRDNEGEDGFTLIELLVVILIIGILAAIALPAFLGQRVKGQDTAAKSDARNMVSEVEDCYATETDYSKCATTAEITASGLTLITGIAASGTDGYSLTSTSKSGDTFTITRAATTGTVTRTCAATSGNAGKGGCRDDGTW